MPLNFPLSICNFQLLKFISKFYWHIKHPVYDKDKDLKELKTLKAEKFSFDDFVAEYEEKIARKQDQNLKK